MSRSQVRWNTKFGRWVHAYGVRRLAGELARAKAPVSVSGVHEWLAGRSTPRLQTAVEIQRLSAGRVTARDICVHVERVRG